MKGKKNLTFKQFMGKESVAGVVFCSPFIIGFLMFMIVPMGISLYYSFCDYNILTPAVFSGAKNYIKMFTDDEVWRKSIQVTFYFCPCICSTPSDLCADRCHAAFKDNEGNRFLPCSLLSSVDHRRLCSSSRSVEEDLGDQRCDQYPVKHHWH